MTNRLIMVNMIDVEIARLQAIRECHVSEAMLPSISVLVVFLDFLGVGVAKEKKDE